MAFPSSIDIDTPSSGTTLVASDDHSNRHNIVGTAITAIENKLGLGAGSAVANQILVGSGAGTSSWNGEWDSGTIGTAILKAPTFNGAGTNSGTISGGMYGTATIQGGTANDMTLGTPVIGTISVPGTVNALSFGAAIAPDIGTIVDSAGGTLTVNAQAGQIYYSAM